MIPGSVPRPVDGWLYYSDGRRLDRRIFAPTARPVQNGNAVLIAAGRPRKPPATAPAEVLRPDALASPGVSFPPDPDDDDGPPAH